jgi:hypothetical protein
MQKNRKTDINLVRFQVLSATSMKMAVFWDAAPCSLVEIDLRYRGAYAFNIRSWKVGQYLPDCMVQHPKREPPSNINLNSSLKKAKEITIYEFESS